MRPGQQNKRGRGRGSNNNNNGGSSGSSGGGNNNNFNRKGGNPLTRTYDSSGPDVKIRGTAQHVAEKYATLARDAQSSGDRVMAENYLQHAEHYNRIIASAQAQMQERFQRDERSDYNNDRDGDDIDNDNGDGDDAPVQVRSQSAQPAREHQPAREQEPVFVDGTGPQPVIDGTPMEVAVEEEAQQAEPPRERAPRRRSTGPRPRRPRRTGDETAEAEAGDAPADSAEAPPLASADTE